MSNRQGSFYLCILLGILLLAGCNKFTTMIFHFGVPSNEDYTIFKNRIIPHSDTPFYFAQYQGDIHWGNAIAVEDAFLSEPILTLDEFFDKSHSLGLMVIREDTILYERYSKSYNTKSLFNSFSMVKSMVTTLIEIAIDEGKINSMDDYMVDYLPEYKHKKGFNKIKIAHLIEHESGIYVPRILADAPFYWGNNLRRLAKHAFVVRPPERKFVYSSINIVFLALILEKVTHQTLSSYMATRLWQPLGMEADALWSIDATAPKKIPQALEKSFCCLNARMVDFAKYGRLFLNQGNFNGKQIVSKQYIENSIKFQPPNKRRAKKKLFFHNNWAIGPKEYGSFYTWGLWGQTIYVYPKKKIIIVRFSKVHLFNYNPQYILKSILQIVDQL